MQIMITNWLTVAECAVIIFCMFYTKGFVSGFLGYFRNRKKR
jgi:hypothetical protein